MGKKKVGVQVFMVISEGIATGILWGLKLSSITPFTKKSFKYVPLALFFENLLEKKSLTLTFTIPHLKETTMVFLQINS